MAEAKYSTLISLDVPVNVSLAPSLIETSSTLGIPEIYEYSGAN